MQAVAVCAGTHGVYVAICNTGHGLFPGSTTILVPNAEESQQLVLKMAAPVTRPRILVVDDDESIRDLLAAMLEDRADLAVAESVADAVEVLRSQVVDILILDLVMPGKTGLEFLSEHAGDLLSTRVVVLTSEDSPKTVVRCMRRGAHDFLAKPFRRSELLETIELQWEVCQSQSGGAGLIEDGSHQREMSLAYRRAVDLAARAAGTDLTVVLEGPTGVGKERMARFMHRESGRSSGPFTVVDCASISESLFEAELFGAVRGSYTGIEEDRVGLIERGDQGTIFLDELGELPLRAQSTLLRVLQEGRIRRIGEAAERSVDIRVIAATNRDLATEVEMGRFRLDLYHRLSVFHVHLPSLAERGDDVITLARQFCSEIARAQSQPVRLSAEAVEYLQSQDWPGNVRQLRNAISRAVALLGDGELLLPGHFVEDRRGNAASDRASETNEPERGKSLDELQWTAIQAALQAAEGNVSEAARILGINRTTIYRRIARERARVIRERGGL